MPETSVFRIRTALTFGIVFLTISVSRISSSPGRDVVVQPLRLADVGGVGR